MHRPRLLWRSGLTLAACVAALCVSAHLLAIDSFVNGPNARATVVRCGGGSGTTCDAAATSIVVASGRGALLPAAPFNLTWFNVTNYPDIDSDPNYEIVRVTAKSGDTLTVVRPALGNNYNGEGSTNIARVHSGAGVYQVLATVTKRFTDDIATEFTGPRSVATGGTGIGSYAVGDILQATAATTFARIAAVATGNVLLSGGVATTNSWGKVGLTTHVSGTLAAANGGTSSQFFNVLGPSSLHNYTFTDADATIADLSSNQTFSNKKFQALIGNGTKCVQTDNAGNLSPASGTCGTGGSGVGSVTSVGVTVPSWLTVSGSPVTTSGTIAIGANTTQAHKYLRGPVSGADAAITTGFIDPSDFPSVPETTVSSGFTADYNSQYGANFATAQTIALPATSGHAYATVVVRMDRASANATIDPNASETVDGQPTIPMVAGESGIFQVNAAGTAWNIISYTPVAMRCVLYFTTTQTVSTHVKINLNTSVRDVGGMADTTNHACVVQRAGDYDVKALLNFQSNTPATYFSAVVGLALSGANSWIATHNHLEPATGTAGLPVAGMVVNANVGDAIALYGTASNATALVQGVTYGDSTAASYLVVTEVLR